MKTVVIFGGSGFIGQHIIRRLAKKGFKIIIPYQKQVNEAQLRLLGTIGQIIPIYFKSINEKILFNEMSKADVVFNLKTQWSEKKTSFENGIFNFNKKLIDFLKSMEKNKQFIFFSGIGANKKNNSKRSEMILKSEKYIQENLNNYAIIRPGVVIGFDDQFIKKLVSAFKMFFFVPQFGNGKSKIQPVFVDDISIAIDKILTESSKSNHIFELVGNEIYTYKELYSLIASYMSVYRIFVPIPYILAEIVVSLLEKTLISPLNSEQLKLFKNDNIASNIDKSFLDLNIQPQDVREIIKRIVEKNI